MEESKPWSEWAGKRSAETAETLRKLCVQADESLNARRRHLSDLETELNHRIQQVASELAHELVEARAQDESNTHEKLLAQIDQLASQVEQEAHQQDQLNQELTGIKQELAEVIANRDQACQSLSDHQAQPCEECESLQQRVAQLEQVECEQTQRQTEQKTEQVALQEALQEARAETEQQAQLLSEREIGLQAVQQESKDAQEDRDQFAHQLEQSQGKFELVSEDVQKLKLQNADLQETLSQRSEAEAKASAELDSLRAERDALAARVGELEDAPPVAMDADQQEKNADLQQRFEMAIDDVRQLKQEKSQLQAELQTQLEAQQTCQGAPANDGPLDWQAQKALMLASLAEEEGESISPQRQQDRTTIEDTLSITDRVVAEKDQALVELHEQLAALQADLIEANLPTEESQPAEQQAEQVSQEALLTDDEIIQLERARLAQLQQEWEDKLRQAELDISIERATLAREQAALEEKLATVQELSPEDRKGNDQRPRRRWMAALGIKSDDEGK